MKTGRGWGQRIGGLACALLLLAVACQSDRSSTSTDHPARVVEESARCVPRDGARNPAPVGAPSSQRTPTTIVVGAADPVGRISPYVYGVNHRYPYAGFGMWDAAAGRAWPRFLTAAKDAGFAAVRFPGGRMANTYKWKRAIGPNDRRTPNVNGGGFGQPFTNEFGPDEFGRFIESIDAEGTIVVNFATGTARDAASLVEYMNSPVGTNPNGGIPWAERRARNGHPEPYDVRYWEVGNELNSAKLYWMGKDLSTIEKAQKYIFGGSTVFEDERVAKSTDYQPTAAVSNGEPDQNFHVKYPPVQRGSETIFVDGDAWDRVDDLAGAGAENVYEFYPHQGRIVFGDGVHGKIPGRGAVITSSYTSGPHEGFNEFYSAMKAVDPSIEIGTAIHTPEFTQMMGSKHPYDFLVVHSYGYITEDPGSPKALHEYVMRLPKRQGELIRHAQDQIATYAGERAADIDVVISEYAIASGLDRGISGIDAPKGYRKSLGSALYLAQMLKQWIVLGIPLAQKHSLIDSDPRNPPDGYTKLQTAESAVIGPSPCFTPTASAYVFKMFSSMMGDVHLPSWIDGNRGTTTSDGSRLEQLVTVASRDDAGNVYLIVVNRDTSASVTANIEVRGAKPGGRVTVWSLNGPSHLAFNTVARPKKVAIRTREFGDLPGRWSFEFPAHSVTALKLPGAPSAVD